MYKNSTIKFVFFLLIIFAVYLCYIGGYGSDEDTLPMIGTFSNFINGNFMTSRFTGYPVAEFIIGFLSYFFGSFSANLFIFLTFILGAGIFFITLEKKYEINNLIFFLILLLSNPILFFDNLEPVDYSIAFFFFSIGYFFLIKNKLELAVLFFGICIGARINFVPFIFFAILLSKFLSNDKIINKITIIFSSLFIGSLFYLPVWIHSGLGFDWLRAGRPGGTIFENFARFSYKTIIAFGILQFLFCLYVVVNCWKNIFKDKYFSLILSLVIINLLIFFYIPAELSYLQPMLIFLYYLFYKTFHKKYLFIIIVLNFCTWFINFQPITIVYKSQNKCDPIVAQNAYLDPKISKGYLFNYIESRQMINCWIDLNTDYGKKIYEGKALKK